VIRLRCAAALALAALVFASVAHADPSASDKAMAEALFRDGKELRDANKPAEACPKFAESHRLDPKPGTILNLATCYELDGKTASAWAAYTEAATIAARARQSDREKFARAKVDELEKKLSYVKLDVAPTNANSEGFAISIDTKAIALAVAGTRIPLDPGEHTIEARAWGKQTWSERVTIAAGPAEVLVAVPMLPDARTDPGAVAARPATPTIASGEAASVRGGSSQRTLGWVALGVGAAGVIVGGIFGLMTIAEKNTVDEHCTGSFCDAEGLDANESAKDAATVSTIAFATAGIAVVAGVVLFVTAPKETRAALGPRGVALVW
jgi:hypothetical protein